MILFPKGKIVSDDQKILIEGFMRILQSNGLNDRDATEIARHVTCVVEDQFSAINNLWSQDIPIDISRVQINQPSDVKLLIEDCLQQAREQMYAKSSKTVSCTKVALILASAHIECLKRGLPTSGLPTPFQDWIAVLDQVKTIER